MDAFSTVTLKMMLSSSASCYGVCAHLIGPDANTRGCRHGLRQVLLARFFSCLNQVGGSSQCQIFQKSKPFL